MTIDSQQQLDFDYRILEKDGLTYMLIAKEGTIYVYSVKEFASDLDGRAFRVTKLSSETGKHYNVLVSDTPFASRCDCLGFEAYGKPCKHLSALMDYLST